MNKYLILFSLLLSGCGTMCDYAMIPPKEEQVIEIDPKLFEPCKDLLVADSPITPEGILINLAANKVIYTDCAIRMAASIVVLKKFSNN